jgi:photosystem II stability/assembly factor-like uncharacterized protein
MVRTDAISVSTLICIILCWVGLHAQESHPVSTPPPNSPSQPKTQRVSPVMELLSSVHRLEQELAFERTKGPKRWEYKDAYLYWLRQRSYPNDTINWRAYLQAFSQKALMPKARFRPAPGLAAAVSERPVWQFLGPVRLPVPYRQYYGEGWTSGRVNGIAFANDDTIYVASAGGGLWKTPDKGKTWQPLSDSWENTKSSAVTIDPDQPDTVYVGTGDFDGGVGVYGFGIMKTGDAGKTWTNLGRKELKGFSVRRILVHPDDSKMVVVAAGRNPFSPGKLLQSDNAGASWKPITAANGSAMGDADWEDLKCGVKDTAGNRSCFAVGASYGGLVVRTKDKGVHWDTLNPPLSSDYQAALSIAPSKIDPKIVYLLSGTDRMILKSDDSGNSWWNITGNFPRGDGDYNWSQNDYDFFLETSTRTDTNQDVIFAGLIDFIASTNGGQSWTSIGQSYSENLAVTHNDQHCLAVNPNNSNEVALGNDGGVYIIAYDSASDKWSFNTTINAQLGLTQFYRFDVHPSNPEFLLGGAQDNATPITFGEPGKWSNIGGGDGGYVAISPSHPDLQFATGQYLDIYRTDQSWKDWDQNDLAKNSIRYVDVVNGQSLYWSGDPVSFIAPIALDPVDSNILYAATNYLWRWNDASRQWEKHLGDRMLAQPSPPSVAARDRDAVSTIAIAPSNRKRIYTGSQTGQLWMSDDAGQTWKNESGSGLPQYWVTSIAVHPQDPDTILVGLSGTSGKTSSHPGHVWKCTKLATNPTCTNIKGSAGNELPNIPVNAVLIDPKNPAKLFYVASDVGVFLTKDGGITWGDATSPLGLPNVQVNDLKLVPGTDYLAAATFGRGIWRIKNLASVSLQPRTLPAASKPKSELRR